MNTVPPETLTARPVADRRSVRKVVIAGALGTMIEYYDFSVYGFLATTIAQVFFPASSATAGLLYTLAVFGAAFVLRPLGGILLGHIGDRLGRRPVLLIAVLGMAFASCAMGVLPGFAAIGVAAPLLLLLLRCVQGLSAGGELGGAAAYVAESAPDHRRGFLCSTTQVGTIAGTLLGSLVVAVCRLAVPAECFLTWGWRLPFLLSLPLGIAALLVRRRIEESAQFETVSDEGAVSRAPVFSVLRTHFRSVLVVCGLSLVSFASYYLVFTYMGTYFEKQRIMSGEAASWSTTAALTLAVPAILVWGRLTDRWGRKPVLVGVCLANLVFAYPLFLLMGSGWLAGAVAAQIVLGQFEAAYMAVILATFVEAFPARVRTSGFGLGYNLASILAGGSAPYIATWLISSTGDAKAPAWLLLGTAVLSLTTALSLRETAGKPLRAA